MVVFCPWKDEFGDRPWDLDHAVKSVYEDTLAARGYKVVGDIKVEWLTSLDMLDHVRVSATTRVEWHAATMA